MSESESVDSPAFVRQRRNLIVASLVLAFALKTDLTVHKLSFFGLEGSIAGPVSTVPYLCALCVYFLWRYWTAFSVAHKVSAAARYKSIKKTFLEPLAVEKATKPFDIKNRDSNFRAWMPHEEEARTPEGATVAIVVTTGQQDGAGGQVQRNFDPAISEWELRRVRARTILHMIVTSDELSSETIACTNAAPSF